MLIASFIAFFIVSIPAIVLSDKRAIYNNTTLMVAYGTVLRDAIIYFIFTTMLVFLTITTLQTLFDGVLLIIAILLAVILMCVIVFRIAEIDGRQYIRFALVYQDQRDDYVRSYAVFCVVIVLASLVYPSFGIIDYSALNEFGLNTVSCDNNNLNTLLVCDFARSATSSFAGQFGEWLFEAIVTGTILNILLTIGSFPLRLLRNLVMKSK